MVAASPFLLLYGMVAMCPVVCHWLARSRSHVIILLRQSVRPRLGSGSDTLGAGAGEREITRGPWPGQDQTLSVPVIVTKSCDDSNEIIGPPLCSESQWK